MTNTDQDVDTAKKSGGSIGFLRASEKMHIATFEIPLTFLEDLGFSKDRIQAAKDFNRRFISGFYGRVRAIGERMSGGGASRQKGAQEKAKTKKVEATKVARPATEDAAKTPKEAETKAPAKKPSSSKATK